MNNQLYKVSVLLFITLISVSFSACSAKEPAKVDLDASEFIHVINKSQVHLELTIKNTRKNPLYFVFRTNQKIQSIEKLPVTISKSNFVYPNMDKITDTQYFISKLDTNASKNIRIDSLKINTKYYFDVYSFENKSYKFIASSVIPTITNEPKKASKSLAFGSVTDNSMYVHFSPGSGNRQMLIAKKGSAPDLPKDGFAYTPSATFANPASRIGNTETYVLSVAKYKKGGIKVEGLTYGEYFFRVIDLNGEDGSENYLTDSVAHQNLRSKYTMLTTPTLIGDIKLIESSVPIKWNAVEDADYYELVVANNPEMTDILPEYNNSDIGNITEYEIFLDNPNKLYYFTIKAKSKNNESLPTTPRKIGKN